ncbi:MAG: hypothetical protein ACREJC_19995 [Tepidisphaeraceae bacterium]
MVRQAVDVLKQIESLPERDQTVLFDYLALHLDDVLDEARWQQLFSRSPAALDALSAEVNAAIAGGDVAPLDPDEP